MGKSLVLCCVAALALCACNGQKGPAEAAFAQIQASLTPISADLEKYAPAEYEKLSAQIDDMKSKLNTKDYAGALAVRNAVMTQLVAASSAAGKRKNELAKQLAGEWRELSPRVTALLTQLNTKLANLQGAAKLPGNLTAAGLQQAKQTLSELSVDWAAAMNAIKSRDADQAVTKGHAIEKRAAEVAAILGVKS